MVPWVEFCFPVRKFRRLGKVILAELIATAFKGQRIGHILNLEAGSWREKVGGGMEKGSSLISGTNFSS